MGLMKKVLLLGSVSILSLLALVGCGKKEPEDHIWEADKEITDVNIDYNDFKIQIDGNIISYNLSSEQMNLGDLMDALDSEQYSFEEYDSNEYGELNSNDVSFSSGMEFYIRNTYIDDENNWIYHMKVSAPSKNSKAKDCTVTIKKANDEYVGSVYYPGGIPASIGAFEKSGLSSTADLKEFSKDAEYKDNEEVYDIYSNASASDYLVAYDTRHDSDEKFVIIILGPGNRQGISVTYEFDGKEITSVKADVEISDPW